MTSKQPQPAPEGAERPPAPAAPPQRWMIEAYTSHPNIRIQFTVMATSLESARQLGERALNDLRITGTWKV